MRVKNLDGKIHEFLSSDVVSVWKGVYDTKTFGSESITIIYLQLGEEKEQILTRESFSDICKKLGS